MKDNVVVVWSKSVKLSNWQGNKEDSLEGVEKVYYKGVANG